MIVLAIDTAGVDCSAALFDSGSGRVLSQVGEAIGKGHAERLMAVIEQALDEAGLKLDEVERIAVCIGPGSFTGIRVGVAAARGLSLALGVDCVGVTTLEALAQAHLASGREKPVLVAMDAKRDEIYAQAFSAEGSPLNEPAALRAAEVSALAEALGSDITGSFAAVEDKMAEFGGRDRFDIATIARIGAGKEAGLPRPKPLYLRGPDAKPQTGFALPRLVTNV